MHNFWVGKLRPTDGFFSIIRNPGADRVGYYDYKQDNIFFGDEGFSVIDLAQIAIECHKMKQKLNE